ncbi:MAG: RNA-guided endonuclease InsQ/TnpB family protein [Candidatus Promineifilaceae bacterium]
MNGTGKVNSSGTAVHHRPKRRMKIRAGMKYRIFPNNEQQQKLAVQFGHSRFVYNTYLAVKRDYYAATGKSSNYNTCANDLTHFKKEEGFEWLKEADSQVLQQSLKDLDTAFQRFFKGLGSYPKFKSKHHKQSFRYPQRFKLNGGKIYLPKVGWVRITLHRSLRGKAKNCTVSKTKTGKYFVSILCEWEQEQFKPLPDAVGIDLGITHFATLSTGEKINNPRMLKSNLRRLKLRQRRLSRKQKGSNKRSRARHVVAVTHEKIANQRRDFHHQLSRYLVDRFGYIALEDLNIKGLMANHKLAPAISDVGWAQFIQFVKYKQHWNSGVTHQVDRWFASSKLCSACGAKHQKMSLSIREWRCTQCGTLHDRDENASQNILAESLNKYPRSEGNVRSRDTRAVRRSAWEAQLL